MHECCMRPCMHRLDEAQLSTSGGSHLSSRCPSSLHLPSLHRPRWPGSVAGLGRREHAEAGESGLHALDDGEAGSSIMQAATKAQFEVCILCTKSSYFELSASFSSCIPKQSSHYQHWFPTSEVNFSNYLVVLCVMPKLNKTTSILF
jgi:hypothetical protein